MSMTGRRAFASKIIKDSNVDIRHRLAKILAAASTTASVITNNNNNNNSNGDEDCFDEKAMMTILCHQNAISEENSTINSINNSLYGDTWINDLVDPIDDYEDFVAKHSARIAEQLRSVLLFPFDDVMVEKYQPPIRTLEPESLPEFHNLKISEDPYIQCIGACNLKSLIVIKRYEKNVATLDLKLERKERFKQLKRQHYEVDSKCSSRTNNESLSVIESQTPNTIYSCSTLSTRNTPRPQSLISSSSTIRPPLASDEEDFIADDDNDDGGGVVGDGDGDGDDERGSRTPLAIEYSSEQNEPNICDNITLHQNRNSWTFIDAEQLNDDDDDDKSILNRKQLFFIKNAQNTDAHIQNILEKNYDQYFTQVHVKNCDLTAEQQDNDALALFCLYRLQQSDDVIEHRPLISPPSDVPRYRFRLKCLSLEMDVPIEPLFASIAIYDSKAKRKITENFHFDLNSESMKHLLQSHVSYQDLSTLSKSAIFSLSHLSPDMYFVIKLEKIFQSDINDLIETYQRPPDDSNKMEKLKMAIKNNCERLGRYRMFFAWAVFPLVDVLGNCFGTTATTPADKEGGESMLNGNRNSSNSLDSLKRIANECTSSFVRKGSLERHLTMTSNISNYSSNSAISTTSNYSTMDKRSTSMTSEDLCQAYSQFKPVTITSRIFYRHEAEKFSDEDLYKFLVEFGRSSLNSKRVRHIPSTFKLDISPIRDENSIKCRVNPELVRLHPYTDDRASPIKEILEFRDLLIPHQEHRNLLYVYPRSVNFTSRQNSARNVTVKVQILSSEEKFSAMCVIFGKSSCPEYLSEAYTSINYHNRNPNFSEEFKIRLPSQLNKQTHLLFTFIHVHTKPKNDVPIDEIVGYSWLPLLRDDCLQTGTFSLPIVSEMPTAGYSFLNPNDMEAMANLKWIDNRKPLFVVHIDSYSSIFAQDAHVDRFFRITSLLESHNQMSSLLHSDNLYEEFCLAITGLQNSNIDSLVKFVHIILNRLIMLMVRPPSSLFTINEFKNKVSKQFKSLVFETLVSIVAKINSKLYAGDYHLMRSGIVATFIHYQAIFPQPETNNHHHHHHHHHPGDSHEKNQEEISKSTFHEEIVMQWLSKEHSNESTMENLYKYSFLFFDLIFKSLCITVSLTSNSKIVPRLPVDRYLKNNLNRLVHRIGDYMVQQIRAKHRHHHYQQQSVTTMVHSPLNQSFSASVLNGSLAFFIRDLLSIVDRHYVFSVIKIYLTKISNASTVSVFPTSSSISNKEMDSNDKNRQAKINDELFEMKVSFLRIICGHEHFVALNLAFGTPLFAALEQSSNVNNCNAKFSPSFSLTKEMLDSNIFSNLIFDRIRPYSELTDDYRRQHWLIGLVFCVLLESFTMPKDWLQNRAADLIQSILNAFDWDHRFKDVNIRHRAACLFLPLIGIMIDVIDHLHDTKDNCFYSACESRKRKIANSSKTQLRHDQLDSYGSLFIENSIAMAIGSSSSSTQNNSCSSGHKLLSPSNYRQTLSYQPINKEATETLLSCLMWTIGNVDHGLFIQYLNEFSNERLLAFLELLRIAMRVFEYQGAKHIRKHSFQKLDDAVRNGPARKELIRRRDYSQSFAPADHSTNNGGDLKLRWKRGSTITRYHHSIYDDDSTNEMVNYEEEIILEGHLCTMINLIVLDSITLIVNIFRQRIKCNSSFIANPSSSSSSSSTTTSSSSTSLCLKNKYGNDEFVVASALHALLQLFSLKQSSRVLEAAFDSQRAILHHFPELLFIDGLPDVEFCSELCYLLLKHCASQTLAIRANASASIYLLLRQYYQSSGHYSRIKIQITMSLSQLVGTSLTFNEINIRNALNNILLYALNDDSVRETQFPNQVRELVYNLIMILSDTMQMKEYEKDSLMLLDLMYRVAKGYQNSPELRITWLENMAKKHLELSQKVEAAQCLVHAAALVSECLHKMSRKSYLPVSCAAFQRVCPNVFEESLHSNSDINIDKVSFIGFKEDFEAKKGVQSLNAALNESGLIALLERAAEHFDVSGMYEAVNEIYKLLLPIHETHYNYKELSRIHDRLHKVFIKIEQQEGKRVFATYFRVGFYGKLFNDLNQKEFIYKEPFLTKLPEIANRLETFYGKCFGSKNVEVIKDSNNVDMSKLDANKAYIQITYVEPYFDSWELESRKTCYERNYNIKRFIYSTPFTMDGRAHGQLYEQYKRKTILSVEHAFPYVKTRIVVKNRHQHSLLPIEVAIEDLQKDH
ncbi:dedicator of cytokinesis protein 7-like protein [Dermatophagoides farinae]|uniref:Dedicator of cytokinesis protein 7-like protein n=1 Tax=Dermatophagoides farinae TaxID=6954 RepID=A0A9D4NSX1_DERFA|nr:dedicator of cytokinesis protein 7-like protein [Dermatophagoides farinae]